MRPTLMGPTACSISSSPESEHSRVGTERWCVTSRRGVDPTFRRRAPAKHAHQLRWKVGRPSWGRANMVTFSGRPWRPSTSEADTDRKGDGSSWETSNTWCTNKMDPALPSPLSQNGAKQVVSGATSLDSPESISMFRAAACQFRLKRCADAHPMYYLDTFLHLSNPLSRIAEVILV